MATYRRGYVYLFFAALFAASIALALRPGGRSPRVAAETPNSPGIALSTTAGVKIGEPITVEDVTLFPIFADVQQDPGPITTLPAALSAGTAEVREQGAGPAPTTDPLGGGMQTGRGATVNTLVIENRGDVPIYVLAGTVVKGGQQDRQIGQDFVVGARSAVPVDAFCVEHGRWTVNREGTDTGGKFVASDQLAASSVRVAGQYGSNQSEVWAEVAKVNTANKKSAASGTLMASLDAEDVKAKREALARRIMDGLDQVASQPALVGVAHALDGKVRGVRWFASHALFTQFRDTLVNTAASDAITARSGSVAKAPPRVAADDVRRFVSEVDQAKVEERATRAKNVNDYKKAKAGFGSTTKYKPSAAAPMVPLSSDYAAH